jgi:hypothetical protein
MQQRRGGCERGNLVHSSVLAQIQPHSVVVAMTVAPSRSTHQRATLHVPACCRSTLRRCCWQLWRRLLLTLPLLLGAFLLGMNGLLWMRKHREWQEGRGQRQETNDAFTTLSLHNQDSPFSLPQRKRTKTFTSILKRSRSDHTTVTHLAQRKQASLPDMLTRTNRNSVPLTLPRIPGVSQSALRSILQAQVHLVEISTTDDEPTELRRDKGHHHADTTTASLYTNVHATFCRVDWSLYESHPNDYPFFRDLVAASHDCRDSQRIQNVPLHTIVHWARHYDDSTARDSSHTTPQSVVRVLNFTAAVFHESRCGSTLTANLLVAMDATRHRVYSEATPANDALHHICGDDHQDCSMETAVATLRDVVYLMSRTDDLHQERVFFKFQAAAARALPVFTKAFPNTPYLFVYREPVQVIMSHLQNGMEKANCLRSMESPPPSVEHIVAKYNGRKDRVSKHRRAAAAADHHHHHHDHQSDTKPTSLAQHLEPKDYCAAHLASIAESVVSHLTRPMGRVVNYRDLPDAYYHDIFPRLLGQQALSRQQLTDMQRVATLYSKNRQKDRKRQSIAEDYGTTFRSDSEHKERQASHAVRRAAETYLAPSYLALEAMAANLPVSQVR